jgi:hypothetical protein
MKRLFRRMSWNEHKVMSGGSDACPGRCLTGLPLSLRDANSYVEDGHKFPDYPA